MTCIERDSDFDTKKLWDLDIEILDKMEDKRVSGFYSLTYDQIIKRVLLWAVVVAINEMGWVNPHDPNFVFSSYRMKKWSAAGGI